MMDNTGEFSPDKRCQRYAHWLKYHKRCKSCSILLHRGIERYECDRCGKVHTAMAENPGYCVECFEKLEQILPS